MKIKLMATALVAFSFCAHAQIFGGSTQAKKVVNSTCTDGQVPIYSGGKQSGCGSGGGGSTAVEVGGSAIGTEATINFIAGSGVSLTGADAGSKINVTASADTAVMLSRATGQGGADNTCIPASASGTTFTCSMAGATLTAYTNGMRTMFRPDAACSGTPTLNINTLGAKNLYASDGTTAATCTSGLSYWLVYNTALNGAAGGWTFPASGGSSGGTITLLEPTGKSMDSALAGPAVSANQVIYWKFAVLTSTTVRYYNAYPYSSKGVGTQGFGLMDSSCNRVTGSTATVAAPGSAPIRADMGASITLTPGMYYIAYTSTSATDSLFGVRGDFSGQVANQGFSDPNLAYFSGATASASGVVPTSCGTQTGLSSSQSLFFVRLSN